jgi:tetratricopeptide (TPR) repeat protein
MNGIPRLLALLACALGLHAQAALTEGEKALLMSQMSAAMATELGKGADARGLERIIAIGDPALVQSFDNGMRVAQVQVLPPAVEALVVRNFNDARVGAALRALTPRYQTRALFDLHYHRIEGAYQSGEPSLKQIFNTEVAGVEEVLLRVAPKFTTPPGQINPAVAFAARRRYPGAAPFLVANLGNAYSGSGRALQHNATMDALLAYPSPDVWRQAGAEVERLRREGKIGEDAYAAARKRLDAVLQDPDATIARMNERAAWDLYMARSNELQPSASEVFPLQAADPARYVDEMARRLEGQEAIAAELRTERTQYDVAQSYGRLGAFARFRLGDARRAVGFLERGAKGRDLVSQVLLADTYQLALNDRQNAIRAYRLALDTASETGRQVTPYARPGEPMNEFWKAWLSNEVAFLLSGRKFRGTVPEDVIRGFWESMWVWARLAAEYFPEWASAHEAPAFKATPAERAGLGQRLAKVPASRLALMLTLRSMSALPDADAILRELARSDPSGYWTTVVLGTVAYYDGRGAAGREEAESSGLTEQLPGFAGDGRPNALVAASRRHMKSQELRAVKQ